jgi:hypothetical protein
MSDFVNNHVVAYHVKANAVITRANAIPACQIARKSLCPTDGGPRLQPLQDAMNTPVNDARQFVKLRTGFRRELHGRHT